MTLNSPDRIKNYTLNKFVVDTLHKYHDPLLSIIVAAAFGGTAFYLFRGRSILARPGTGGNKTLQEVVKSQELVLADLPPETRKKIWEKLEYDDILKLRLVAQFMKDDVDNWVGVKMRVSNKFPEPFEFSQRVALQSCCITDLPEEVDPDFFFNPSLMMELELHEIQSNIILNNLNNLLIPCINLRKLQLHFLYSIEVNEISELILNAIRDMQHLEELRLFRLSVQSPTFKFIPQIPRRNSLYPVPMGLVLFEAEIPDLSSSQVAAWKYILEQQTHLRTLLINFGVVHWQFIQKIIPRNPNLERISLEGICNINPHNESREAFDWRVFENCQNLKSLDIASPPIIDFQEIGPLTSINFRRFPCRNIEEFYVYKIEMSPEDVRRVYVEMTKLSNGSLNQIGELGTETAAEMFWVHAQQQVAERHNWVELEQWWDILTNFTLGISVVAMIYALSRNNSMGEIMDHDELTMLEMNPEP